MSHKLRPFRLVSEPLTCTEEEAVKAFCEVTRMLLRAEERRAAKLVAQTKEESDEDSQ